MSYDAKAAELGLELPPAAAPIANYVPSVRTGNLVFLSGHGPVGPDGLVRGKLGADLSIEEGAAAARLVMIGLLGSLKSELGSLDQVQRIVKLLCMVNCTPDFGDPPKVANGASDLLVELFGDAGKHARSAVGMNSLPMGMAVEIEMIVEVAD
jgi:enamine deaminase RidA (YjgF/YER057c/UK114 family)